MKYPLDRAHALIASALLAIVSAMEIQSVNVTRYNVRMVSVNHLRNSLFVVFFAFLIGCKEKNSIEPTAEDYARAVAIIAKYNELNSIDVEIVMPQVGDKCADCNSPPGKCGIGKVGDGVTCLICETCGGDGNIDDKDLSNDDPVAIEQSEKEKVFVNNEIVMLTRDDCYYCNKWKTETMSKLTDKGWKVKEVYYSGQVPVFQFKTRSGKQVEYTGEMTIDIFNKMFMD